MGNSKAGGVEGATWAIERRYLIHLIRVKGRTHCGGWETTLSARMPAIAFHWSYIYPSQLPLSYLAAFDLLCILIGVKSISLTHRDAFAVDALHHSEGRPQVRVPGVLQAVAAVAEAAL